MKKKPFTENIFQTMLNLVYKDLDINDRMDMIYIYYSCETLLQNCQNKNKNMAKYQWSMLLNNYEKVNTHLKKLLGIIFYPAGAYYEYVFGDLSIAKDYIKTSLKLIDTYESLNPNFIVAKIEQNINLYKIAIKKGNFNRADQLSFDLISFIKSGKGGSLIPDSKYHSTVPNEKIIEYQKYFKSISTNSK